MESQPQNPEFRKNPENFHPCNMNGPRNNLIRELCYKKNYCVKKGIIGKCHLMVIFL